MNSNKLTLELQPMDPSKPYKPDLKGPATLELVPAGPSGAAAPYASLEIDIAPMSTKRVVPPAPSERPDRFMLEASHQYAEGHLDQPLWDRAYALANGDKEAAVAAYLQARAIALKLLDRERRSERSSNAAMKVTKELDAAEQLEDFDVDASVRMGRGGLPGRHSTAVIAGAILVVAAVAGWFAYSSMSAKRPEPVRATPAAAPSQAAAPAPASSKANVPAAAPRPTGASPELLKKIQELRDSGSANVLVLYLVEWTRKEPGNAEAWDQLRAGYASLKQYGDALAAAKKAQELMPDDAKAWRNLGIASTDAGDPVTALKAFEQAVARDDRDADSFTRIGVLNAQLSQLPEAGRAFDRALAISPGDHVAQCMRTAIAPLSSAPKDTYATAKQVRAIDAKCRGG